jgi:endonuclease/exonuclease/phosphatase family metal-dependent hydrolase
MQFARLFVTGILAVAGLSSTFADENSVRIVSYNIHHGEGTDGKLDLDRIASVILAERPDVVCLQEVDRGCARTGGVDMPVELAKRLNMEFRFGPNLDFDGGEYGNCTFSSLPICEVENFSLPFVEGGERRGCLRTVIEIGDQRVDVLNTHFDLLPAARKEQAAKVVDITRDVPTLLAGDLNDGPDSAPLAILSTRFTDTHLASQTDTIPISRRIDFVLVSGAVNTVSSHFVDTPTARVASDHLPYTAHVALAPAQETARDRGIRDNQDSRIERALFPERNE